MVHTTVRSLHASTFNPLSKLNGRGGESKLRWTQSSSGKQTEFRLIAKSDSVGRIGRVSEITLFTASRWIPLNHHRAVRAARLILPIAMSGCIDRPPVNLQIRSSLASESPTAIGANSHAFVVTYLRNRHHIFCHPMSCSARWLESELCRSVHSSGKGWPANPAPLSRMVLRPLPANGPQCFPARRCSASSVHRIGVRRNRCHERTRPGRKV